MHEGVIFKVFFEELNNLFGLFLCILKIFREFFKYLHLRAKVPKIHTGEFFVNL